MPNPALPHVTGSATAYPSGTRIAPHRHPAGQLIHAISGAMHVSAQGQLWILPLGRGLWIPAGVEHAIRCDGEVRMRSVYFSPACAPTPEAVRLVAVSALAREALVRVAEGAGPLRPALRDLLLHEIAAGSIAPFRLPIPSDPRLARLAEALRTDPGSQATVRDWAKALGFSERSLIRRIRDETGMTFRELRRQTRVMVAIDRLATGRSVTVAAMEVGFESPSAFIHAFRQVTGTTPRRFLAAARD